MQFDYRKLLKWGALILLFIALAFVYKAFDPIDSDLFPQCPFHSTTGLLCPGCGSQRAIHCLLNFDFVSAFSANALLVLSIPYLLLSFILDIIKNPNKNLLLIRKIINGSTTIWIVLSVVILFWVLRNVL